MKKIKKIKNIIFDLGGVVIDLDRNEAVKGLSKLGIPDVDSLLGEYEQKGPFLLNEKGEITVAELFDILIPKCNEGVRCRDIMVAYEEFLRDLPIERLQMIRNLRKRGYKVFVLSNTNPIMFNDWIDKAFRAEGKTMNDYFDGIVVSYQEKLCKPDPRIFKNLIVRYGLNPEETLMLDDSAANCSSARSIGLEAIQITKMGDNSFMNVCENLLKEEFIK